MGRNDPEGELKRWPGWMQATVALVVGAVFGSGGVWQCQQLQLDREKQEIEKVTVANDLRKQIIYIHTKLADLVERQAAIISDPAATKDEYERNRKRAQLDERIRLHVSDLNQIENKLAAIEGREPRMFKFEFLPPAAPSHLEIH